MGRKPVDESKIHVFWYRPRASAYNPPAIDKTTCFYEAYIQVGTRLYYATTNGWVLSSNRDMHQIFQNLRLFEVVYEVLSKEEANVALSNNKTYVGMANAVISRGGLPDGS